MGVEVRPGTIARLRQKNQLTVPDAALAEIGAVVGDRFLVSIEDGTIRLERVLPTYAGSMAGVYPQAWAEQLRKDRDEWRG